MSSTFKSNDTEISEILKNIHKGINQLPEFQRDWVWDDDRIRSLITSIINSYPVGALMFLEYGGDTVRFKYRPFTGVTRDSIPELLVLDGQQRLTSIYGAMYCKNAMITKTDKNKIMHCFYYIDIKKSLSNTSEREDAVFSVPENKKVTGVFGREILRDLSTSELEYEQHMFPLNIAYDSIETSRWRNAYQEYHGYDKNIMEQYSKFEAQILRTIYGYKVPVITLDKNTSKEAVCKVFENVNTGGVSLTVFELVTASFAAEDFDLRKDWDIRHEKFLEATELLSKVESTDFLTALTLISRFYIRKNGGEAVRCTRKDILELSLADYRKYADKLTEGFIKAAYFLNEQRIFTAKNLPYISQLIPLSALFTILDSRANDSKVKNKISRWYWCGVLGEMYGGANETRYANDVTGVTEGIDDGEVPDTIARAYFQAMRLLSLQSRVSAAYKGIMALILKTGAVDFISGTDMGYTNFTQQAVDIHHIFPKAYCEKKYEQWRWDSVVNKTPLTAYTNRVIGGAAPKIYLKKIERDGHVSPEDLDMFIATHLIDIADLRSNNFNDYFPKRAKALLGLISKAMGKQARKFSFIRETVI